MAINYTPTTPVTCILITTDDHHLVLRDEEVSLLAFGWADAQPEKCTGVWVLGANTRGVTFIPTKAIYSLAPIALEAEADRTRTHEIAVTALDLVSDLRVKVAQMRGEVHLAEDVAFGAMGVAFEAADEVNERGKAEPEAAAKPEAVASSTRSGAARSTPRKSSSAKTTGRTPTGRASGQKRGR